MHILKNILGNVVETKSLVYFFRMHSTHVKYESLFTTWADQKTMTKNNGLNKYKYKTIYIVSYSSYKPKINMFHIYLIAS